MLADPWKPRECGDRGFAFLLSKLLTPQPPPLAKCNQNGYNIIMNNAKGTPKDLMEAIAVTLAELGLEKAGATEAIYTAVRERLAQDYAILAHRVALESEDMVITMFNKKYPRIRE